MTFIAAHEWCKTSDQSVFKEFQKFIQNQVKSLSVEINIKRCAPELITDKIYRMIKSVRDVQFQRYFNQGKINFDTVFYLFYSTYSLPDNFCNP
jgi:hypothetical protein